MVLIKDLSQFYDKDVSIKGWVYNTRRSGKIGFLIVRDGTGVIQCIVSKNEVGEELFKEFKSLTQESSICVDGTVVENKRSTENVEIIVNSFSVLSKCEDYPITPKEHGVDFLMSKRHLWIRSKRQHAILKIEVCVPNQGEIIYLNIVYT